jgi:ectoine hydroxylase
VLSGLKARARTLRPFWYAHNVARWRSLRGNRPLLRGLGVRRSPFSSLAHRHVGGRSEETPWLDRPDADRALSAHPEAGRLGESLGTDLETWVSGGYLRIDGYLPRDRVDAINANLERLIEEGTVGYHYRGRRVTDAFRHSQPIRDALTDPELARLLGFLMGRDVRLFQTINFFEGSEQPVHSDAFHMTTEPKGYLVGAWIALEDIDSEAGPVVYYPGSHRLPYLMSEDLGLRSTPLTIPEKDAAYAERVAELAEGSGIEPVEFTASAGDLLLWHANLLHGGRPVRREGATRRSLVAHYFADGALCYHEVTERPAILSHSIPLPA